MVDPDRDLAAIDLGSNSFHMIIARRTPGGFQTLDKLKEPVRLASGIRSDGSLSKAAESRALACLHIFGERIRDLPPENVRAVATNTFRRLKRPGAFLSRSCDALGHTIEIIPGREEARLVYVGVAHTLHAGPGRRFVVDIGGGSTECIIGYGVEPILTDSLFMGCVSYSQRFFPNGELSRERFRAAQFQAALEVETIAGRYCKLGWDHASGSSGTIGAISSVLQEEGISPAGAIDYPSLKLLRRRVLAFDQANDITLRGLDKDRAPVLAGGLAILMGVFKTLRLQTLEASTGALREGLVYEMLGRSDHDDIRERTVLNLSRRFNVDLEHAHRVGECSMILMETVGEAWGIPRDKGHQLLRWVSILHEVGLFLNHSGYHKHGAYLLRATNMPGFTRGEKENLASIVGLHRRKLAHDKFDPSESGHIWKLVVIFRIAVLLNRSRANQETPDVEMSHDGKKLFLMIPKTWIDAHPLARVAIEDEIDRLAKFDLKLMLVLTQ